MHTRFMEHRLLEYDPSVTVAFTGHRTYRGEALRELDLTVEQLTREGYTDFLCGMALGFDMAAAESVMRMRTLLPGRTIRLTAVVPFRGQASHFGSAERSRYHRILESADRVICLAESYSPDCYMRRNDFLVDNSTVTVAWYDGAHVGGTHYTVQRARRRACRIINLRPSEQLEIAF